MIQAFALAALWIIKSTPASLIFPLMVSLRKKKRLNDIYVSFQVLALVGFRKVMDFFPSVFSQSELFWLDNLMPESKKKDKKKDKKNKNEKGTEEVKVLIK